MSDMVERVARVITLHAHGPSDSWRIYEDYARAVIEAMRDPTPAMMSKGCQWYDDYERSWQAMIDEALK